MSAFGVALWEQIGFVSFRLVFVFKKALCQFENKSYLCILYIVMQKTDNYIIINEKQYLNPTKNVTL